MTATAQQANLHPSQKRLLPKRFYEASLKLHPDCSRRITVSPAR